MNSREFLQLMEDEPFILRCGCLECWTDGNNVPGIHVVFRLYYVHFLFCRVKNMLL